MTFAPWPDKLVPHCNFDACIYSPVCLARIKQKEGRSRAHFAAQLLLSERYLILRIFLVFQVPIGSGFPGALLCLFNAVFECGVGGATQTGPRDSTKHNGIGTSFNPVLYSQDSPARASPIFP